MSPFQADTGYEPRTGLEAPEVIEEGASSRTRGELEAADDIAKSIEDLTTFLRDKITWAQEQQAYHANEHRSDAPLYKEGDLVYVDTRNWKTERPAKKLDDKYAGPWPVTRIIPGSKAIEVDLPKHLQTSGVFNVFHPNLLRLYQPNPVPLQDYPEAQPVRILDMETGKTHQEFLLDEIVDSRRRGRGYQYKIKWTNDPKYYWEPIKEFIDHYDAWLFHWKRPRKPRSPEQVLPDGWMPKEEDIADHQGLSTVTQADSESKKLLDYLLSLITPHRSSVLGRRGVVSGPLRRHSGFPLISRMRSRGIT